jgi:hypothetical protein
MAAENWEESGEQIEFCVPVFCVGWVGTKNKWKIERIVASFFILTTRTNCVLTGGVMSGHVIHKRIIIIACCFDVLMFPYARRQLTRPERAPFAWAISPTCALSIVGASSFIRRAR